METIRKSAKVKDNRIIAPEYIRREEEKKGANDAKIEVDVTIKSENEAIGNEEGLQKLKAVGFTEIVDLNEEFKLSFIEKYEEEDAKRQVKEYLTFDPPRQVGFYMAVAVYVPHKDKKFYLNPVSGKRSCIIAPDSYGAHEKFTNCVGLVIDKGPECHTGWRFEEHWLRSFLRIFFNKWMKPNKKVPWCKVGDWIIFPRNQGTQINYRGVAVQLIKDEDMYSVIEDPRYVTRD